MTDETLTRKFKIERFASKLFSKESVNLKNTFTVLASPAWRGIEADISLATEGENSAIIKFYHNETKFYVDYSAAALAADQAGKLGVGPLVLDISDSEQMIALEELGSAWTAGGLHHIIDPIIRQNIVRQKKYFQSKAQLNKCVSLFDEVDYLYQLALEQNVTTHSDLHIFQAYFKEARQKLKACGWDEKPCHRDGNTSNLMINDNKNVKLIDFDLSANCDPFEDIGVYLRECFENDTDAREGFEEWTGYFNEGLFQRCMIYGLADDYRWGLIAALMEFHSTRRTLEFSKYASWRFIRLESQAKGSCANDRIRMAS